MAKKKTTSTSPVKRAAKKAAARSRSSPRITPVRRVELPTHGFDKQACLFRPVVSHEAIVEGRDNDACVICKTRFRTCEMESYLKEKDGVKRDNARKAMGFRIDTVFFDAHVCVACFDKYAPNEGRHDDRFCFNCDKVLYDSRCMDTHTLSMSERNPTLSPGFFLCGNCRITYRSDVWDKGIGSRPHRLKYGAPLSKTEVRKFAKYTEVTAHFKLGPLGPCDQTLQCKRCRAGDVPAWGPGVCTNCGRRV